MHCTPRLQRHSAHVIGAVELLVGAVAGTPQVRFGAASTAAGIEP